MANVLPSLTSYKTALEILMYYINNANIESAHALLKDQEISIDLGNDIGMTPLHQAVKVNNLSFVNLLLDYGANPNVKTEWRVGGETPLMIACINNYYEIGKLLLDYGADPTEKNTQGLPCLHLACMNGSIELAMLLVSRGCDITMRDGYGNNAAYWAKRNGFDEFLKLSGLKPETVSPMDNQYYRDCVEEKYLLISPEEKKKMMKGKGKGKKKKKK
jgi:ankyrin repeat protein